MKFYSTPSVTTPLILSHAPTSDTFLNIPSPGTFTSPASPPIFPTVPPWIIPCPNILLKLCSSSKVPQTPLYTAPSSWKSYHLPRSNSLLHWCSQIDNHAGSAFSIGNTTLPSTNETPRSFWPSNFRPFFSAWRKSCPRSLRHRTHSFSSLSPFPPCQPFSMYITPTP